MAILTVDPYNIGKDMTVPQLEWWILFGICVANKPADITEKKLNSFFNVWAKHVKDAPFETVKFLVKKGVLAAAIKQSKFGQYTRIARAFKEVSKLDVRNGVTVEMLEAIHGIGPKTARMIVLYYDPQADCVPLDTHVLKYLASKGLTVPKSTPPAGKRYEELERAFRTIAKSLGKTVRELDTEVWLSYAKPKKA